MNFRPGETRRVRVRTLRPAMNPQVDSSDFHEAFATETRRLAGERLLYFTGIVASLALLFFTTQGWDQFVRPVFLWLQGLENRWPTRDQVAEMLVWAVTTCTYSYVFFKGLSAGEVSTGVDAQNVSVRLLRANGAFAMVLYAVVSQTFVDLRTGGNPIGSVFAPHLIACICLPWNWRQALKAILPLFFLNAFLVILLFGRPLWAAFSWEIWGAKLLNVLLGPAVALPGIGICVLKDAYRHNRFKMRFLESGYGQLRRELVDARKVHESIFPKPESRGPLGFTFRYEPMKQIGGDYLFARFVAGPGGPDSLLHLVLVDVTGHGVTAALTVNRIAGEIERLYGEHPDPRPSEILRALNRYIELTMGDHAIYATALAMRIDTLTSTLTHANAGHPPAFIRHASGATKPLIATTMVLGVVSDAEFHSTDLACPFTPGDTVIGYTDGVFETRKHSGAQFGIGGVEGVVAAHRADDNSSGASPALPICEQLLRAVDSFREGPVRDDVLIVQATFNPAPHTTAP